MKTAVVIATHRRRALFERLLGRLAEAAFPQDVHIRVVENGPACGVEAVCHESPLGERVRYGYRPVGNKALALNQAIVESDADFLIFLDDDITPPPGIIDVYVDAALRWGPGFFFGGGLVADAERECPAHLVPHLPRSAKGWFFSDTEREIPASAFEFFFGANWAAFRSDLERAGLFAPELGISESKYSSVGEETELQRRMVGLGARAVYLPGATILHPVPAESYTTAWVWRRRFRLGVAEWLTVHAAAGKAPPFGLPAWVLRSLMRQKLHGWRLALCGAPVAARTDSLMEEAHLTGLLYGAWTDRRNRPGRAQAPNGVQAPVHQMIGQGAHPAD